MLFDKLHFYLDSNFVWFKLYSSVVKNRHINKTNSIVFLSHYF